jgi:Leucine-rich repeat (LRR) protein
MKKFNLITMTALLTLGSSSLLFGGIPTLEKDALVSLYNHTHGENWKVKTHWLEGDPCDNRWKGIYCNHEKSSVTRILLYSNNLVGTIPDNLHHLQNLTYLSLGNNILTGQIPASLGQLSNLTDLRLYKNCFSGVIPESLSGLSNLTTFNLSKNRLEGEIPKSLGKLTKLKYFTLGGNKLTGTIPKEFKSLKKLQHLRLYSNQLTGEIPKELGELTKLQTLHLYNNNLDDKIPTKLEKLKQLESLKLGQNNLTGKLPPQLTKLLKLEELYLERNQLTGEIPKSIQNMKALKCVRLYNNELYTKRNDVENFLNTLSKCFTNVYYTPKCNDSKAGCNPDPQACLTTLPTNKITNGSFENYTLNNSHGAWKEVTLDAWNGDAELWTNLLGQTATDGEFKIEMDSNHEIDSLSQMVMLENQVTYRLSLNAYARSINSSDFEIWIDETKIATVTPSAEWMQYNFDIVGNGGVQTLSLKEVENQNNTYGAVIDNVTLTDATPLCP